MIDPRALARELRQSGTRFAALRQLKLLLRTQQPCGGGNGAPQYCALANCVDYVAQHDHMFPEPDAMEVIQLASAYQGFTAKLRAKLDGWLGGWQVSCRHAMQPSAQPPADAWRTLPGNRQQHSPAWPWLTSARTHGKPAACRPAHIEHEKDEAAGGWCVPYDGISDIGRYEGHGYAALLEEATSCLRCMPGARSACSCPSEYGGQLIKIVLPGWASR